MTARLETARLALRLARTDEAHLVADYHDRNRAQLARREPEEPRGFYTDGYLRERLAQLRREEEEGRLFRVHLFDERGSTPRVVGTIGLSNIVRGAFYNAQVGFGLDAALEGQGYMREALEATIAHAFGPLALHRLEANHQPQNLRSAALLRRLGFVPTGYARDYLRIDGAWRDHVQSALINDRWVNPSS